MVSDRPIKMFIYQPLYLKGKGVKPEYVNCKTYKFPYARIEVGDVFTGEKRVAEFLKMKERSVSKVVSVTYNYADMTCGIILEDKIFNTMEKLNKYVS